jgi:hypothetical protein
MHNHESLKRNGLKLTQLEAQELHPIISGIAQGRNSDGIVYPDMGTTDIPKSNPLQNYYAELQSKNNALLKENGELLAQFKKSQEDQIEIEKSNSEMAAKIGTFLTEIETLQNENKKLTYQLSEANAIKVNGDETKTIEGEFDKPKGKPGRKAKE